VTVVAGPPIDLSSWAGAEPSTAVLQKVTEAIMLRLRDMLVEVRGGPAPPLWVPAAGTGANGTDQSTVTDQSSVDVEEPG
jgi:hypothetical protein